MNNLEFVLFIWAVTATIAAAYYAYYETRHRFLAKLLADGMRLVAKGKARLFINDDGVVEMERINHE